MTETPRASTQEPPPRNPSRDELHAYWERHYKGTNIKWEGYANAWSKIKPFRETTDNRSDNQ